MNPARSERRFRVHAEVNGHALTLPRVWAAVHPGGGDFPDTMGVGFQISDHHGDPLAALSVEFPWPHPRPWTMDLEWPTRAYRDQEFAWRRPRGA